MSSFLLKKVSKQSFYNGIKSLDISTQYNYIAAINKFEKFSKQKYNHNLEEIINELKSIKGEERDLAYFSVLQEFVNWLIDGKLSNATVNMYSQIITYFFSFYGIRVHPIDLRHNVKKPKKIKEKLHVITKQEIQKILNQSIEKRKTLYLTLIGSGMRIQECVSLRKSNFDLSFPKRIKIEIPAQYTKARTAHTTFVSKEAEFYLRPYLECLENESLVFATNPYPLHAKITEIDAFSRTRDKVGLTEKYSCTNRHHITLHSFRSYFFTRARRIHDTDIAHALVGHTTYLDMYDRKDDDEKLELFMKIEPELLIYQK